MKIVLIISSLLGGGAERILASMANYWAKKGWDITVLTLVDENEKQCYKLVPEINYKGVGVASSGKNPIFSMSNLKRLKLLRNAIYEKKPDAVVVSFDTAAPTERHRIYEAYKAQRPEVPADLAEQFLPIRKMISAFNIPVFEIRF